jgi:hypothetical protein
MYCRMLAVSAALLASACTTLVDPKPPAAQPTAPEPTPGLSHLAVTAKTSWPALKSFADGAIAKCHGVYPGCLGTEVSGHFIVQREGAWEVLGKIGGEDFGWKGSVWRWDPLDVAFANQTISASVKILYHVKVGFTRVGGLVSCGYGQSAREIKPMVSAKLTLAPEWHAVAAFSSNVKAGSDCQLSLANVNVTPDLERGLDKALKKSTDKISEQIKTVTNVRPKAEQIWAKLADPIELAPKVWLDLRPVGALAGPLSLMDNDQYLGLTAALQAQPRIVVGEKPVPTLSPLPPLKQAPINPAFSVLLRGSIDFAEASRRFTELLAQKEFTVGDSWPKSWLKFRVTRVAVSGNGNELVVAAKIEGSAEGVLYLVGKPRFIQKDAGGIVVVEDLDYTVETRNVLVNAGNAVFHNRIAEALRSEARWDVSAQLNDADAQLRKAINRDLSPQARLEGTVAKLNPREIWLDASSVNALVEAQGQLAVVLKP